MSTSTAPERRTIPPATARNVAVDLSGLLDTGELLTGTPTVSVSKVSGGGVVGDLVASSVARITTTKTINGRSVAANNAVGFSAVCGSSAVKGTVYKLTIAATTDATPAQTPKVFVYLTVEE